MAIEEKYGIAESEIKTLKLFVIILISKLTAQDGSKVPADETFVLCVYREFWEVLGDFIRVSKIITSHIKSVEFHLNGIYTIFSSPYLYILDIHIERHKKYNKTL